MMRPELFIDGAWRQGGGAEFASRDPGLREEVWKGAAADADDVGEAIAAARLAFPGWAETPLAERIAVAERFAAILKSNRDDIARIISREMGKPLWDARSEVDAAVGKIAISIQAQAERAGSRVLATAFGAATLEHRPHGVLAVFGPYNFPVHLPNGHITPALLAGDCLVFKPSELAPGAGSAMVGAWEEAGLPAGVLNLVQGGREVGARLLDAAGLNGVLFTGSADTGLHIHRKFAGRPDVMLALEMGGNNPLIVWPPHDVGAAVNLIAHSAYATSGQRCSCARRLIVPDDAHGRAVIDALVALAPKIAVGAWNTEPEPFMGPLVNERAAERAIDFEADLLARGAEPLVKLIRDGALVRPGLVDVTGIEAPDEELFGPLLQVHRVADFEHALDVANATRFGLSAGLVSDDPELWAEARAHLRAGILNWNRPTTGASSAMPFGGPGLSGSLRPSAYYAADYCAYPVAAQTAEKAAPIAAPGLPA